MDNNKNKRGFIKTLILIIIALALIKLVWDFDIVDFIKNPSIKAVLDAIWGILKPLWDFLKGIFSIFSPKQ